MQIDKVTGALGARISGIDVSKPLGADLGRAEHRLEVAVEEVGAAAVEEQQLP